MAPNCMERPLPAHLNPAEISELGRVPAGRLVLGRSGSPPRARVASGSRSGEVRIMGSKSSLLRLLATNGVGTAAGGVPSVVPNWRRREGFEHAILKHLDSIPP